MSEHQNGTVHHASAAHHHMQAAHYHREASRHYQVGKDYAHAAHQALLAHGHAMQAIAQGDKAKQYYDGHAGKGSLKYPEAPRSAGMLPEMAPAGLSGVDHHAAAADHHDKASWHHDQAAKHDEKKDHVPAGQEAQLAHGHARYAVFHGDEAAKHHIEHFGKSGPTAEIT